jgi:hypothetical protein
LFADARLSVVFIDDNDGRRQKLVQCLEREGIPVVAAASVAELEGWPVGKVLVTPAASLTPLWFDMVRRTSSFSPIPTRNVRWRLDSGTNVPRSPTAIPLRCSRASAPSRNRRGSVPPKDHPPERRSGPAERGGTRGMTGGHDPAANRACFGPLIESRSSGWWTPPTTNRPTTNQIE